MARASLSENDTAQDNASGEMGHYGFDAIGSDDANALIDWLRGQSYQVAGKWSLRLMYTWMKDSFDLLDTKGTPTRLAYSASISISYNLHRCNHGPAES